MGSTGGRSGGRSYHHEAIAITTQATLRSCPLTPDRNVAVMDIKSSVERRSLYEPGSLFSVDVEYPLQVKKTNDTEQLDPLDMRSKRSIWQDSSLSRQPSQAKATHRSLSVPSTVRPRQQLRLPSFKSLGITPLYPDALLTPPDEASLIHWTPSPLGLPDPPLRQSSTAFTGEHSTAAMSEAPILNDSIAEGHSAPAPAAAAPLVSERKDEQGDRGSTSSSDEAPEPTSWIETVAEAIGTLSVYEQSTTHN